MNYLDVSDYENYGLEASLPVAWCTAASALIDAHCRRPTLAAQPYTERLRLAEGRNTVRLTYLPLIVVAPATSPLVAIRARYAMPRRGEHEDETFLMEVASVFGLPGLWTTLDPSLVDYSAETGELTLRRNVLGLPFNEVEVSYTAGILDIPAGVKAACAQVIRNALSTPALNVRFGMVERMRLEYFSDTLIDATVRALLAPYVAQKVN